MVANVDMAMEGVAQLDPELQWLASESATTFAQGQQASGKKATVRDLVAAYCPVIASAVFERMGESFHGSKMSAKEATKVGCEVLVKLDPNQDLDFYVRVDIAARFVAAAARLKALGLSLVSQQATAPEYWPFGQDGGFCNPNKL